MHAPYPDIATLTNTRRDLSVTTSSTGRNSCASCFAEFEWTPFTQDGEDFCCSGCSEGGPCICTYDGAPHLSGSSGPIVVAAVGGTPGSEDPPGSISDADSSSLSTSGNEPPSEPPAPSASPGDGEIPTNGRLAVIMSAVSEMPLPVQEVVRARLSNEGSDEEIGEPLGLTGDEVRQLIDQGQAILDRSIGDDFRIRYIGDAEAAQDESPEPEFPSFDELEDEDPTPTEETEVSSDGDPSELGKLITRSIDALSDAPEGDSPEESEARELLSEALREAANLFQIASERLEQDEPSNTPLRAALSEPREGEEHVVLVIRNPEDIADFFLALQSLDSVEWARLEQATPQSAEFGLVTETMVGIVREIMALEGSLKPTRLQMSGNRITVELPPQGPVRSAPTASAESSQRFELSVDSFFGARHFVDTGDDQTVPHHHSYRVEARFLTSQPDDHGFVVGFAQVREMVDSTVMAYSETLLNTQDPFREVPPTTENLARIFHQQIVNKLGSADYDKVRLKHVRVWESPTNSATYSDSSPDAAATA